MKNICTPIEEPCNEKVKTEKKILKRAKRDL